MTMSLTRRVVLVAVTLLAAALAGCESNGAGVEEADTTKGGSTGSAKTTPAPPTESTAGAEPPGGRDPARPGFRS